MRELRKAGACVRSPTVRGSSPSRSPNRVVVAMVTSDLIKAGANWIGQQAQTQRWRSLSPKLIIQTDRIDQLAPIPPYRQIAEILKGRISYLASPDCH
jgi:uncharacterized membrane protein YfbV (UPF0208 family)